MAGRIDLGGVTAIDVHVHAHRSSRVEAGLPNREALEEYFHGDVPDLNLAEIAAYYRERQMVCVVFSVDTELVTGRTAVPNDEVAEAAAENADVMIPFASIDPRRGVVAVREARRLIEKLGVRGFKFHPNSQAFFPNDRMAYPLYEVIAEAGLPAIFHTGHTGIGAGTRGGSGVHLKYSNPMCLDDVAVDFPDMLIVLAHPSFPWQDEAISVALHKPNVYIDLSGWSPRYFPPQLVQYANTLLREKVLFGSDFPLITPDRWLADFAQAGFREDVRPLILKENAARLLGLATA